MSIAPEISRLAEALLRRHGGDARHIAAQGRLRARQAHDAAAEKAWSLVLQEIVAASGSRPDAIGSIEDVRVVLARLDGLNDAPPRRQG